MSIMACDSTSTTVCYVSLYKSAQSIGRSNPNIKIKVVQGKVGHFWEGSKNKHIGERVGLIH